MVAQECRNFFLVFCFCLIFYSVLYTIIFLVLFFRISLSQFFYKKNLSRAKWFCYRKTQPLSVISETYNETYSKPTNLLQSFASSEGKILLNIEKL